MNVNLAMENPGQIPSFEANGEEVLSFILYGDQISASLRIPLADTLDFTLRSMNREITGAIRVPRRPNVVVCNGVELIEGQENELEPTETYEFEWAGGLADYYSGYLDLYDPDLGSLFHSTVTEYDNWFVEEPNGSPYYCSINAYVGSRGEPGEGPLIEASWAEGYIFAESYHYTYNLGTALQQPPGRVGRSAMDRLERILGERKGIIGDMGTGK